MSLASRNHLLLSLWPRATSLLLGAPLTALGRSALLSPATQTTNLPCNMETLHDPQLYLGSLYAHFPSLSLPSFLGTCLACWCPLSLHSPPSKLWFPFHLSGDTSLLLTQVSTMRFPWSEYQSWHLFSRQLTLQSYADENLCVT